MFVKILNLKKVQKYDRAIIVTYFLYIFSFLNAIYV